MYNKIIIIIIILHIEEKGVCYVLGHLAQFAMFVSSKVGRQAGENNSLDGCRTSN